VGEGQYEFGRIYVDPDVQDRGVGQEAMRLMFEAFPEARKWTVGTPSWAIRNQHVYEKVGFVRVRETAVDPQLGWSGVEYERCCPGDREGAHEEHGGRHPEDR